MPWLPLALSVATAVGSGASAIAAGAKRRRSEKKLENMKTPTYTPNQSILDYYNKALTKFNTSATDTAEYKADAQTIKQNTVQGIGALRDRRSSLGGISNLIAGENNSLLRAAGRAEARKANDLSILGDATRMKAGEDQKAFNQNSIAPFEKNYNLEAMKAAGQAEVQNRATQNAYANANAAASMLGDNMGDKSLFKSQYGNSGQWKGAYNYAKQNNMNFGQYNNQWNKTIGGFKNYF